MKPTLYMTIGISGSGKSTYLNKNFDRSNIISPDDIRKKLTGDVSDQSRNKEVFEIALQDLIQCIKNNGYAVLDSTNVSTIVRGNTIRDVKAEIPNLKTVGLIFRSRPEVSKARIKRDLQANKDRANVPDEVIDRQFDQLKSGYSDIKNQFDVVKKINESKISLSNILHKILKENSYRRQHEAPAKEYGTSLDNLENIYPSDIYSHNAHTLYKTGYPKMDFDTIKFIQKYKNSPNDKIKIYRAIPKKINSENISNGDWVTINKNYAIMHGKNILGGDFKIISKIVSANELYTDGNSIHEWGYWSN